MIEKYKNKYRIASARLQSWDYGSNGAYFITICTHDRVHFFGEVENGRMVPTAAGELALQLWNEIPQHFPYAVLDEFVVMPNHLHGILIIDKMMDVETRLIASLHPAIAPLPPGGCTGQKNPMLNDDIARIIRWYKGRCTYEIRKINPGFTWQSRYYDIIVRNAESFARIRHYIVNNPENWNKDKFYENE